MADNTVNNSPSMWNAGDGYAYLDYLSNIQGFNDSYDPNAKSNGGASSDNSFNMLDYAAKQNSNLYYSPSSNTLGSLGNAGGDWGNAASTIIGDYNNASIDTGSSVLSGAASGALAGTQIMPGWGTAIGAVVGGLAGLFGSKSKKKQAEQQYQMDIQKAVAPYQQQQANYLQKQQMTQAAMKPYEGSYQPNGYQFKNNLFGNSGQQLAQPIAGSYQTPSGPPTVSSSGLGKPIQFRAPQATFTPAPTPQAPQAPTVNQGGAGLANYADNYAKYIQEQNQLAAAQAMNPYAQFNGG